MFAKWTVPSERNRLRVSILLATGGLIIGLWAAAGTTASVTGVLSTLVAWITGGVAVLTGWLWLRSYGDRWHLPFAATGGLLLTGSIATVVMGEIPKILLLAPFYGTAPSVAIRLERNRVDQWREEQRARQAQTFSAQNLRDDPLVEGRERTRMDDADARYPATLRELKIRLNKTDGDPWA